MSAAAGTRLPHLPALDGLRGAALLGVLFFHSNKLLPGGYLGVDLFFVLSGYLITSLLLAEHADSGRIALKAFWIRRARRLFPALLSLIPFVAIYSFFFAQPDELAGIRGDALATLGYVANWRAVFVQKSYWAMFAAPSPLEHTWSLSIEEQFYVVWPLIVWLVLRFRNSRSLLILTLAASLASIAAMLVLFDPAKTSRVYLGTDTRATSILAGAALACILSPRKAGEMIDARAARKLDVLGLLSAIGLAIAWARLDGQSHFLYHGGFWLTELASLVLIACAVAGTEKSIVARVLAFRPLTLVGTISYGLYLWHWPVNVFLTQNRLHITSTTTLRVVQFAAAFAIAIVSYRFLERPIRTRGLPFGRPIYIVPAAVALAVLLVVRATHARPGTVVEHPYATTGSEFAKAAPTDFKILILGDSTANSIGWTLRGVHRPGVVIDLSGRDGCTMLGDTCYGDRWKRYTTEFEPHASLLFLGGAFQHGITSSDGKWIKSCHHEWDKRFEDNVTMRLRDLLAPKTRVFLATIPYGIGVWETYRGEIDCINTSIKKVAKAMEDDGITLLDLGEHLCPNKGKCEILSEGNEIRPDGVHYDMRGAGALSRWVLDQLAGPPIDKRAGVGESSAVP